MRTNSPVAGGHLGIYVMTITDVSTATCEQQLYLFYTPFVTPVITQYARLSYATFLMTMKTSAQLSTLPTSVPVKR